MSAPIASTLTKASLEKTRSRAIQVTDPAKDSDPQEIARAAQKSAPLYGDPCEGPECGMSLDLWREYASAAADGAFDPREVTDEDPEEHRRTVDGAFHAWRAS